MKKPRWYNLQIKNNSQTDIWEKIPSKERLKTYIRLENDQPITPTSPKEKKTSIEFLKLNVRNAQQYNDLFKWNLGRSFSHSVGILIYIYIYSHP